MYFQRHQIELELIKSSLKSGEFKAMLSSLRKRMAILAQNQVEYKIFAYHVGVVSLIHAHKMLLKKHETGLIEKQKEEEEWVKMEVEEEKETKKKWEEKQQKQQEIMGVHLQLTDMQKSKVSDYEIVLGKREKEQKERKELWDDQMRALTEKNEQLQRTLVAGLPSVTVDENEWREKRLVLRSTWARRTTALLKMVCCVVVLCGGAYDD
jgi:cell division protein FtsL